MPSPATGMPAIIANSFVQHTLRRKGLLPPALPERFRRCGHLHDQTTLAVRDGDEVVVLVEGLCLVVYGINDDEPAAADFRCGNGFAQCIEEQLLAISLTPQRRVDC